MTNISLHFRPPLKFACVVLRFVYFKLCVLSICVLKYMCKNVCEVDPGMWLGRRAFASVLEALDLIPSTGVTAGKSKIFLGPVR